MLEMIMIISETSKPQSAAGTLSRKTSGNGPYVFRSGTRSWTKDSDVVVMTKENRAKRNAVQKEEEEEIMIEQVQL